MEQKPIPGQDVFAPPDAGLAQQYLDTAEQVRRVRGTRLDRRSLGRVQCVSAVALGLYITLFLLSINTTATRAPVMSILLIPFLVWVQVSGGLMERLGFRWRTTRARWLVPVILVVGIGGVALLIGYIMRTRGAVPPWIAFTVGAVVFAAAAVAGAVQLWKGRRTAAGSEPDAVAVPLPSRLATIGVGALIGLATALLGALDGLASALLVALMTMLLVVLMITARTDAGLMTLGMRWRGPQLGAYAGANLVLVATVIVVLSGVRLSPAVTAGAGLLALALLFAASFAKVRDA
ncbi:hypothetical protein [Microbacterium sp.]|uniref:hypothetical protein n=1 Tax=Microbacterium sp. TaxID=51671 RepID=UPI00333F8FFA